MDRADWIIIKIRNCRGVIQMNRKICLLGIIVMIAIYIIGCGNNINTVDADKEVSQETSLEKGSIEEAPTKQIATEGTETTVEKEMKNMQETETAEEETVSMEETDAQNDEFETLLSDWNKRKERFAQYEGLTGTDILTYGYEGGTFGLLPGTMEMALRCENIINDSNGNVSQEMQETYLEIMTFIVTGGYDEEKGYTGMFSASVLMKSDDVLPVKTIGIAVQAIEKYEQFVNKYKDDEVVSETYTYKNIEEYLDKINQAYGVIDESIKNYYCQLQDMIKTQMHWTE